MRNTLLAVWLAVAGLALAPGPAAAFQAYGGFGAYGGRAGADARIWVDDDRDYFRRGDRMRVRFSVSDDSYVAVIHVDTDGNLDFLFPSSPWDDEFVRGGRVHDLARYGADRGWTVRGQPGIGYLYLIASPVPLDYRAFRGGRGGPWDWSYAGRGIHGDPFWAMEQITRLLLPDWGYTPYTTDYYTYQLDGRHRYPAYACSDRSPGYGWGWGYGYGGCDRMDYFLRDNPYYYDTRRYRGDRRAYFRDYGPADPRHGYKEDGRGSGRATPPSRRSTLPGYGEQEAPEARPAPRPEARPRPMLERRPPPEPQARPHATVREREPAPAARGEPERRAVRRRTGSGGGPLN